MEKVFSAHFQTNIYLSPPQAQGFGTHLHGQGSTAASTGPAR
jgi:hypothetical protein